MIGDSAKDSTADSSTERYARNENSHATEQFNATTDWWDPQGSLRTLHDINPIRVRWIAERVGGLQGKRILDVGAGGGILAAALAQSGAQVVAIDTAREALQTAKLHALEEGITGMEFRCCTVEELASAAAGGDKTAPSEEAPQGAIEPFDAIVCMELLEHTPNPGSVVKSCARLLRAGGDACFSTINRTYTAYACVVLGAEYVLGLLPKGTHQYSSFIRPAELAQWARGIDLELSQLRGLGYNPITRNAWIKHDTAINYLAHFRRQQTLAD